MQEAEKQLAEVSASKQNPLVQQIVVQLNDAVVYAQGANSDINRKLWDNYAREWGSSKPWLQKMAFDVNMDNDLQNLGDEWASRAHTIEVLQDFVFPFLSPQSTVAEVGVGGGRITCEVFSKVAEFHGYDISSEMVKCAKRAIMNRTGDNKTFPSHVHLHLLPVDAQRLSKEEFYDFIYSFDVFPHVDTHVIFNYLQEFHKALKPGGVAFFSTSDITSEGGWDRFEKQRFATVGGFCFTSPELVLHLIAKAGLKVIRVGSRREHNVYYHRDFLVLVQKPTV